MPTIQKVGWMDFGHSMGYVCLFGGISYKLLLVIVSEETH